MRFDPGIMKIISEKSYLKGEVLVPASKSHTIRAVTLAGLARGTSIIRNPLVSADAMAAVRAACLFGATCRLLDSWEVEGVGGRPRTPDNVVDVSNSGTTLYFSMATAALTEGMTVLTGDEQIVRRPVQPLLDGLKDLGAGACSTRGNGLPPVVVKGPMRGGRTRLQGMISQCVSSLLIHCPLIEEDTRLDVEGLRETPYIRMTLEWLDRHGIRYEASEDLARFRLYGGQHYKGLNVNIPGDFSSAAFFMVAGAIGEGDITLLGLEMDDVQGDKQVVDYLRAMGAEIAVEKGGIRVRGGRLKGLELDLAHTPDALPAMAVAGCFARGKTILRNVPNARLKETDRIAVMAEQLGRLGARVEELPDGLVVHESRLKGCAVKGYGDHRVVMSLAVAGTAIPGITEVDSGEAVKVTVPNFVDLMRGVGAKIHARKETEKG